MYQKKVVRNFNKDPDAIVKYRNDWRKHGAVPATVDITASTFTVPTGLTLVTDSYDGGDTYYTLSGGTLWTTYEVVNHVTLDNGEELDWTVYIHIKPT